MAKGDFDYKRAWAEIAKPAFDSMSSTEIDQLYQRIIKYYSHAVQDANCDMPWPDTDLRDTFDAIGSNQLAFAARVIYYHGHWASGGTDQGAYWRFAHWADQTLARKCGLPEFGGRVKESKGTFYRVCEGFLRVCFSSNNDWTWRELGVATAEMYQKVLGILPAGPMPLYREEKVEELKFLDGWDGGYELLRPFLDTSNFVERGQDEQDIIELLKDSGLELQSIGSVNFKPHPYMIGPKHIEHADGDIISGDTIRCMEKIYKVHCAQKRCMIHYDDHTSDRVAFLKIKDAKLEEANVNLTQAQKDLLSSDVFSAILKEHHIDGLAFVK